MKKILLILLAICCVQLAYATESANLKIKISGATQDNRYFLCIPDLGCFSILAAQKGKVYPIFEPIEMNNIFINNVDDHFSLSPQGLPSSCNVKVNLNQTITIYGNIVKQPNNKIRVNQLHCTVA